MEYEHIIHPFEPVYDGNSEILILGSLPSAASRQQGFYYGHARNRLWSVLSGLFGESLPVTIDEKRDMLLRHRIAMWDVIYECDIKGSQDASVKNAVPCDIERITAFSRIRHVYLNGKTAGRLYIKYQSGRIDLPYTILPSTSPANAVFTLDKLAEAWRCIITEGEAYENNHNQP